VLTKVSFLRVFYRQGTKAQRFFLVFVLFWISCQSQSQKDSINNSNPKNSIYNQTYTFTPVPKEPCDKRFIISCGYGFPNFVSATNHMAARGGNNNIKGSYDKGSYFFKGELLNLDNNIGLGFTSFYSEEYFEYWKGSSHFGTIDTFNLKDIGIGFRFNYYMINKRYFKLYIGLGAGGKIPLETYTNPVFVEMVLGFRFMPIKNVGIYLEIGPSKTIAQGGLSFSF